VQDLTGRVDPRRTQQEAKDICQIALSCLELFDFEQYGIATNLPTLMPLVNGAVDDLRSLVDEGMRNPPALRRRDLILDKDT
jgi:hypothetical protein